MNFDDVTENDDGVQVFEDGQEDQKDDKLLKVKINYPKKSGPKNVDPTEDSGRGRGRRQNRTSETQNKEDTKPGRKSS